MVGWPWESLLKDSCVFKSFCTTWLYVCITLTKVIRKRKLRSRGILKLFILRLFWTVFFHICTFTLLFLKCCFSFCLSGQILLLPYHLAKVKPSIIFLSRVRVSLLGATEFCANFFYIIYLLVVICLQAYLPSVCQQFESWEVMALIFASSAALSIQPNHSWCSVKVEWRMDVGYN